MAHQRGDVQNFSQAGLFVVQLGTLWLLFHLGYGLTSMIWAQGVSQVLTLVFTTISCWKLGLFPKGNWGRPSWVRFWELFAFGRDMFLYMIGFQVVTASQMILISRLLGLEAAAIWSICTRTYTLLTQLVCRIFDMSCSPFAEMIVRREWDRLRERFKSLVVLTTSLSVWTGALFVYGNQAFMQWWTQGKIGWAPVNDLLLALYFVLTMTLRYHTGLAGLTKQFHFLRYMYLVEGTIFVTVACLVLKPWGISAMLLTSVLATLAVSFPYGIFRSSEFFKASPKTIAFEWVRPSLKLALFLAGPTVLLGIVCAPLHPLARLIIGGIVLGGGGGLLLLRYGLDQELTRDIRKRIPTHLVPGWLLPTEESLEPAARQ
jgi:O-antigen/teichoic acid export membrane protein